MSKVFSRVAGLRPGRSMFNLSYEKKFTCDMAQLIPVMCDEVVPGDKFIIGNQAVIRFQPLVAPVLHEINMFVHYFFVPYRILWEDWETFITRGISGDEVLELPQWHPTVTTNGSLWDFFGFPVGINPAGAYPIDFPRRAYNMVYNEYYRDENLQLEVDLDNEVILNRNWMKDYFTSSLPWQQRGTSPAIPIVGTSSAVWDTGAPVTVNGKAVWVGIAGGTPAPINYRTASPYRIFGDDQSLNALNNNTLSASGNVPIAGLNDNVVDLSAATAYSIAEFRTAFQIQKWMERNARAGARYVEFLNSHFGVSPRDDRLQRPEYIGGSKSPIIISEVLQTSSTDVTTPQGNMAGHAMGLSSSFCGKYSATEYGLIIGIMSVMPKPSYQQGIDRQWLRRTTYDFFFPEFVNLSEQAVLNAEIYASAVEKDNLDIFGYQGRYNEMRVKSNMVCSQMRDTFDYWHLGRQFSSLPVLNDEFIECIPSKRIFASESEPGLIVSFGNVIKAFRPLPLMPEPGLIDHH